MVLPLELERGVPVVAVELTYQGATATALMLVDTGSASTIISAALAESIGIQPRADDLIRVLRGIGGFETVFERALDVMQLGSARLDRVTVEVGALDYGLAIDGILGMDVLREARATINVATLTMSFENDRSQ